MGFLDNIFSGFLLPEDATPVNFRATICSGKVGYFENVKSIKSFESDRIELSLKRGSIILKGQNLYIKKYCGEDVCVGGTITSFEILGGKIT